MAAPNKVLLEIKQGATFKFVFRWETLPIIYRAISAVVAQAPVRITAVGHGLTDGWRVAVVSVKGMLDLNAANSPPRDSQYHPATVIDANTIELNDVNASRYSPYTGGGYVQFNTPADMAAYTARMTLRNRIGGTLLLSLTTANGRIAIDDTAKTVTLNLSAAETEAITFTGAVYDLEMVSPTNVVTSIAAGAVKVTREVTTA